MSAAPRPPCRPRPESGGRPFARPSQLWGSDPTPRVPTAELNSARGAAQQGEIEKEELRAENRLLQEKYQEEARKVRMLQERMVEWKRKRGGAESPSCAGSPTLGPPMHPSSLDSCGHLPPTMGGMPSPMHGGSMHGGSSRRPSSFGGGMGAQRPSSSPSAWGPGLASP